LNVDAWQYALRSSYRRKIAATATLSVGLDVQGRNTIPCTGLVRSTNRSREGDIVVFGQPPGSDVNSDAWKVNLLSTAPYMFCEISLGED
jgi:hypothetical protein